MFTDGMFCKVCGVFDADVRFSGDGVKSCACGAKRWSTQAPPMPERTDPIVPWALTDRDRVMCIYFGIEETADGAGPLPLPIMGTGRATATVAWRGLQGD